MYFIPLRLQGAGSLPLSTTIDLGMFNVRRFGCDSKAYIPLRRKIPGVGGWCWAMPPTPEFCVGDTNMLVYFGVT